MKPSYTFLDHTADVLFQAQGNTLAELFEQCALAVEDTQVHLAKVDPREKRVITGEAKKVEDLLFDFLDDLLLYKDSEQLIFSKFEVKITERAGKFTLNCLAYGEKLDVEKHEPKVDVKAITMHLFAVQKINSGWKAKVLVDI